MQLDLTDITWSVVPAGLWIQVEVKVGIVCACLPTLPPLFRRVRQYLLLLSSGSGNSERSPSSGDKNGGSLVVAVDDARNGDASPNREGRGGKRQGWYSQVLNSLSNKSAEGPTESREEIVEIHERKFSDDSV